MLKTRKNPYSLGILLFDFIVGILISFCWLLSLYYDKGHDQKPCSEERVCWVYMPSHSPSLRETKAGTEAETLEEYCLSLAVHGLLNLMQPGPPAQVWPCPLMNHQAM